MVTIGGRGVQLRVVLQLRLGLGLQFRLRLRLRLQLEQLFCTSIRGGVGLGLGSGLEGVYRDIFSLLTRPKGHHMP